ncbi:MAG: hypothetical protein WC095_01060 [Candidatus Paceibacterota bacterium]
MGFGESFKNFFGGEAKKEVTQEESLRAELVTLEEKVEQAKNDPEYGETQDMVHIQRRINEIKQDLGLEDDQAKEEVA